MKISYALNDDHKAIVQTSLNRVLSLIPREFYEICVSQDPETDVLAVHPRTEYRLLNIFVGSGFFLEDKDGRDLMMVHEVTHVFVAPLHCTFREVLDAVCEDSAAQQLAHDRWDQFEERAVCDISFCIHNLLKEVEHARTLEGISRR